MARKLAKSTLDRLAKKLQEERERLEGIIASFDEELESSRLATTGSEFSDPDNADGGTIAAEIKMDLSLQQNARDLLEKVKHAEDRRNVIQTRKSRNSKISTPSAPRRSSNR